MAVIGSIRKRSGLLIGLVGMAMILFVLGDLLGSGTLLFNNQPQEVGVISGKPISYQDFERRVEVMVSQQYQGQSVNSDILEAVREQVWQELEDEMVYFPIYNDLGIAVSGDEMMEMVRTDANRTVLRQFFTDQQGQVVEGLRDPVTGGLDGQKLLGFLRQSQDQIDWFLPMQRALKYSMLERKFYGLVGRSMYVTAKEAEADLNEAGARMQVSFVSRNFDEISDDEVSFTDAELKSYYNANEYKPSFRQSFDSRDVDVVAFPITPSEEDVERAYQEMTTLKNEFGTIIDDTAFVIADRNPNSRIVTYAPGQVAPQYDSIIHYGPKDTVVGPYLEGENIEIAKVVGIRYVPDSVRARHILLAIEGDTAITQGKADSIINEVGRKNNFADIAADISLDVNSGANGGDLDWFPEGRMVPEFNEFCFNGKKGDIGTVITQFGIHIIEITDQTEIKEKRAIAYINHKITAGNKTISKVYDAANSFSLDNENLESFGPGAEAAGYQVSEVADVKNDMQQLSGYEGSRSAVRWAYQNELKSVSGPIQVDGYFLVVALKSINEKGKKPFEKVRDLIELEVIKDKKAEKMIAQMGSYGTLEELAGAINKEVKSASLAFGSNSTGTLGFQEFAVLGATASLSQGQTSKPIQGNNGVFVVRVDEANGVEPGTDFSQNKMRLQRQRAGRSRGFASRVIRDEAEIEDNRYQFY